MLPKLPGDSSLSLRGDGSFGSSGLTSAIQFLTTDVVMTNADTFYTHSTLTRSCVAGTYLILVSLTVARAGATGLYTAKVWDGGSNTYFGVGGTNGGGNGNEETISFSGLVVLGTTTSVRVSVASVGASNTIKATSVNNATGLTNKCSNITFIKVG